MIAHLTGKIIKVLNNGLILDVNHVGYLINCPKSLLEKSQVDQEGSYFTHQHVREDEISLYGFETYEQLKLFRNLLSISGIGPRLATGIIERGSPEEVIKAIGREDLSFFTAVSGVGRKNAARIILELKNRLTNQIITGLPNEVDQENVLEALKTLGFTKKEIAPVLRNISADLPLEMKVKHALKQLSIKSK